MVSTTRQIRGCPRPNPTNTVRVQSWGNPLVHVREDVTLNLRQKINAIIFDQFRSGPGRDKVSCGEYELFNSNDTRQSLSDSELGVLIPGMSITMAFVVGRYEQHPLKWCPRPGCQTQQFSTVATGGRRW